MSDIIDHTNPCTVCRGAGGRSVSEYSGYGYERVYYFEPCWLCRGSGLSTVRVSPAVPQPTASAELAGDVSPSHVAGPFSSSGTKEPQ